MQYTTTVTQKGQITLPKEFRDFFNIQKHDRVRIKKTDKSIVILPTFDILDIAGTIKPRKNKNTDPLKAREYMEKNYKRF
jgi:AbrB family looped-hinge helix DNA binding protein